MRLQLVSQADQTYAVVISTLMEAWEIVRAGLVADGTVKDVSVETAPDKGDVDVRLRYCTDCQWG